MSFTDSTIRYNYPSYIEESLIEFLLDIDMDAELYEDPSMDYLDTTQDHTNDISSIEPISDIDDLGTTIKLDDLSMDLDSSIDSMANLDTTIKDSSIDLLESMANLDTTIKDSSIDFLNSSIDSTANLDTTIKDSSIYSMANLDMTNIQ